jgi:hypothetical protein
MRKRNLLLLLIAALPALPELQTGPPLPYHVQPDWAQLPAGWNSAKYRRLTWKRIA